MLDWHQRRYLVPILVSDSGNQVYGLLLIKTGKLVEGDKVNCERAMAGHTRFGGHMVQASQPVQIVVCV
jgi:hypothetical protein